MEGITEPDALIHIVTVMYSAEIFESWYGVFMPRPERTDGFLLKLRDPIQLSSILYILSGEFFTPILSKTSFISRKNLSKTEDLDMAFLPVI